MFYWCLLCQFLVYYLSIQSEDYMELKEKLDYLAYVALAESKKRTVQQNLDKIKNNADDLDSVLTLRVNSALKQEFSRICKLNQTSASSELKRYMLKTVQQGSL